MDDMTLISQCIATHQQTITTLEHIAPTIAELGRQCAAAINRTNKILLFGNGGSAASCQHLAAELVVRLHMNRRALPAFALTSDGAILTAAANDFSFEHIFTRQVEALAQPGDIAIAMSTSGTSKNVLSALHAASQVGCTTALLTGHRNAADPDVTFLLRVQSTDTARIQEAHMLIGHMLCGLIEAHCCQNVSR